MGRVLAFDYGTKRTGVAVSDPLKMIANGLETIKTANIFEFIEEYTAKESVEIIVFGYPTQMDGTDSDTLKHIKPLMRKIAEKYPNIKLEFMDERYTSMLAQKAILDSGVNRKTRQNRELIDKVSATIILKDYLEKKFY